MNTFAEILQALAGDADAASLDASTVAEYRGVLREGILERAKLAEISSEELGEIREGREAIAKLDAETARREALNTELDEIVSELEEVEEVEGAPAAEAEAEEGAELSDTSNGDDDEGEGDAEEEGEDDGDEAVTAAAPAPLARRSTAAELKAVSPETPNPKQGIRPTPKFTAASGLGNGITAGAEFESAAELGGALLARFEDIKGGGAEKIAVANLKGNFDDKMDLVKGDHEGNLVRLGGGDPTLPEAVTASLACTPREPLYRVGVDSSTARPVLASLPRRRAPRGGYTVYPSPMLADVLDAEGSGNGTGIWTETEDDDPEAVKNACAVITCSTPVQYDIYGVYRCMTVRNLLNMTFPELVEAYLNKLTALWARLAETTLLDAMVNSVNSTAVTAAVNADMSVNQNIIEILNRAGSVYREQERYGSVDLEVWLPRWVQSSLISDAAMLTKYDSSIASRVATEADVTALFNDLGFRPHWTLDVATGWDAIGAQGAGALETFPTTFDMVIAPVGNFQHLDQGSMQLGVTNRQPWDTHDMARNQFTMFWESYEGLLDLGAPSWTLSVTSTAPSGIQLDCCPT